jgi:hypothetical protein
MAQGATRGFPTKWVRISLPRTGATLEAEVAQTPEELHKGLGGRKQPRPMLFIFRGMGQWPMTMNGMLAPLDFLFLDDAGIIVDLAQNVPAGRKGPIASRSPHRYVVELPAGWISALGLYLGDGAACLPLLRR